ncbi:hypothetical protein N8857_03875 [Planktomarina temperata]|nr:hypothetical protein [Planktomarina temperata]
MSQTFDPNAILFIHPSHPSMRRRRYLRRFRAWMRALALLILLCLIYPAPAVSETLRLASYTAALERNAPGLLYRDILYGKSSQIRAARLSIGAQSAGLGDAKSFGTTAQHQGGNRRRY